MQVSTTFRHMDASEAVREYCEDRLDKIRKYFHRDPIAAHAVFSVERGFHHVADLNITLPNGIVIKAKETTEDMYSSIDLAAARIERQVRKWKDRIRDHKPHDADAIPVRQAVLAEERDGGRKPARGGRSAGTAPRKSKPTPPAAPSFKVIKEQTFSAQAMRVEDAVMQMNLLGTEFLVFTNADNMAVAVVYRRKDGNYGLIDTGRTPDA